MQPEFVQLKSIENPSNLLLTILEVKHKESLDKIDNLRREDPCIAAYKIGEELTKIFEDCERNQISKGVFYQYVHNKFYYSEDIIRKYKEIYALIPLDFIGKAKNILLGHLYSLIKMGEKERKLFMDAILLVENDNYFATESIKIKKYYRTEDISILKNLREQDKTKFDTPEKIKNYIIQKRIVPKVKADFEKKTIANNNKRGEPIQDNLLEFNLYAFEPTTEQGVVGLFCTIFHLIAKPELNFNFHQKKVSFSRIQKIQTAFPDALIECIEYDKKGNRTGLHDLYVEFEYKSHNYIEHRHPAARKRYCEMVICWENNWNDEKPYVYILSLKELLEKGQIILHH
ncbi:hypothetical protein QUA30_16325 [Microcoleus sp. Pol14C2]|uniref:hypothetical protein n=1 Tax=unclassified Microcoleus TaxID=2642155 RepID=UPI002FD32A7D